METRAYRRNEDGTLDIITLPIVGGDICDGAGYPLTRTDETEELLGWPDDTARIYTTDGGVEVLVPEPEDAGEYVVLTSEETWGSDALTDDEQDAACERMEGWLDDHEGPHYSISVRRARRGEIVATYQRKPGGNLQIMGGAFQVPEGVDALIQEAWGHACETWPE